MHEHSDAETQLQEEISRVWIDTGWVKRCSGEERNKMLGGCRDRDGERDVGIMSSHEFFADASKERHSICLTSCVTCF